MGPGSYWRITAVVLICSFLAACQQYWRESGIWDIGEHQGLLLDVSNYYDRHALEENRRCKSPYIDAVARAEAIDIDEDRIEVQLHYAYRDFLNDGLDDCDPKRRPLRCTVLVECRGFNSRIFVAAKTETGFEILEMSGEQKRR